MSFFKLPSERELTRLAERLGRYRAALRDAGIPTNGESLVGDRLIEQLQQELFGRATRAMFLAGATNIGQTAVVPLGDGETGDDTEHTTA